ncbi:MAG: carbon monoxide dehydrogenase subunit G [Thermoanaerobaculia bacterium]
MKIQGEYVFDAPRDTVWEAVIDPDVLTRVLPGAEDFHEVGDHEYEGMLKIKVGPVQGKFKGKVKLSDLKAPESYRLDLDGKGAPGFINGQGDLRLEDAGSQTKLHYEIDAKVGGRIASVGQRLLDSTTRVITRQALEGLERQINARTTSSEGSEESGEAPSQSELAAEVARGVVADLIPPDKRPLVGGVAAVVVVALVWLLMRSC